jgi:uncharacterized protein
MAKAERRNIEFGVEGGVTLRGWLFVPNAKGPAPAITMAHGYAGVKEHGIERFARAFAEAGFVVLVHDHRNFGASDGVERGDVDPWQQIADWRRAISFLESQPEVDAAQIGLWGTSYAGGHAIVLAATDRRLRAVVAQIPTISGFEQGLRRIPPEGIAALEKAFAEDDRGQLRGEPLRRQLIVSDDPTVPASYRSKEAIDFYLQPTPLGIWENSITIRSTRAARHESREPFVEFHGFQSLGRCLTEGIEVRPELYCQAINLWRFGSNAEREVALIVLSIAVWLGVRQCR